MSFAQKNLCAAVLVPLPSRGKTHMKRTEGKGSKAQGQRHKARVFTGAGQRAVLHLTNSRNVAAFGGGLMSDIDICIEQQEGNHMYVSSRLKSPQGPPLRRRLSPLLFHFLPPDCPRLTSRIPTAKRQKSTQRWRGAWGEEGGGSRRAQHKKATQHIIQNTESGVDAPLIRHCDVAAWGKLASIHASSAELFSSSV